MSLNNELMTDFQRMLAFRKSIGLATATYVSSVTPFIRYCEDKYPTADYVTREMVDAWLVYYPYKKIIHELLSFPNFDNS